MLNAYEVGHRNISDAMWGMKRSRARDGNVIIFDIPHDADRAFMLVRDDFSAGDASGSK